MRLKFKLLVMLLLLSSVYAAVSPNLDLRASSVASKVKGGGTALFNVTIENNENVSAKIRIFITGPNPNWIQTYNYSFELAPMDKKTELVKVSPPPVAAPDTYRYDVKVESNVTGYETLAKKSASFDLTVLSIGEIFVASGATIELYTFDQNNDPRSTYNPDDSIRVNVIVNKVKETYKNLGVDLKFMDISGRVIYTQSMPLDPAEPVPLMQDIPLSIKVLPGRYKIEADIISDVGSVGKVSRVVEINRVDAGTPIRSKFVKSLLSRSAVFYVENTGNVPLSGTVEDAISAHERYLVTAAPAPKYVPADSGRLNLVWEYHDVLPGEKTQNYVYTVSYVPIVLAVILLLVLAFAIVQSAKVVAVTKSVVRQRLGQNRTEVTVAVSIKNISASTLHDVVLLDNVPPMSHPTNFATLNPSSIKRGKKYTSIEWPIGTLGPAEEIVITYNIVTSFGVVGMVQLPSAMVRFTIGKRRRTEHSNVASCGKTW